MEAVHLTWEQERRLLVMTFGAGRRTLATESAARALIAQMDRWLQASPGPFRLLVDCSGLKDTEPGWRATFSGFFQDHRGEVAIAWYNMTPLVRMTVTLFILATRITGKAAGTEEEARQWILAQRLAQAPPP